MTQRAQPVQKALFGRQQPLPAPSRKLRPVTNDLDLVVSVIRRARDPGYVLVGPSERVLIRDPGGGKGAVEAVPKYEQDTVAQLLTSGHLTVGGTHHVLYGSREGPARAVLVTKAARTMVDRWAALRPLNGRSTRPS